MTMNEFQASLAAAAPPSGASTALQALWWDAKGAWATAHALIAADDVGGTAALVHAYLHRREGDVSNARYWYGRAGRPVSRLPLDEERLALVEEFLKT